MNKYMMIEEVVAFLKTEMGRYAGGEKRSSHAVCRELLEHIEKNDFPPVSTELTEWEKRCARWMTPGLDTSDLSIEGAAMIRTKAKAIRQTAFDEFREELLKHERKPICSIHRAALNGDRIIPCGDCEDKFTCDKIKR